MKLTKLTCFITLILSLSVFSQVKEKNEETMTIEFVDIDTLENAEKIGIDPRIVHEKLIISKADLIEKLGKEEVDKMQVVGINFQQVKTTFSDSDLKPAQFENGKCPSTTNTNQFPPINKLTNELNKILNNLEEETKGPRGVIFISWGYNRAFHSKSDITVKTADGEYTIKDAIGKDRQSKLSLKYLKLSKLTVPQYNLKVGYWFSQDSKFGIGGGTDHMKWVFDPSQKYDIVGSYNKNLWVGGEKKSFDEIKAGKDASFLLLEHSDGYNYPHLEGLYREKLLNTRRFGVDFIGAAGAGILFPKTRVGVADQDNTAQFRVVDNKYHVSGWGVHADVSLAIKYKKKNGVTFFVKPSVRGVAGKINNSLYLGDQEHGRISQSMIYTVEPSVNFGSEIPLSTVKNFFTKKKKKKKKLN